MITWKDIGTLDWQVTEYMQYEWYDKKGHRLTLLEPGYDDMAEIHAEKITERSMGTNKIRFPIPCEPNVYNKAIEFAEGYLQISIDSLKWREKSTD